MSKRMYNNSNYVSSDLVTGTQWDVMLNYISDETNKSVENASDDEKYTDLKTNCNWGNHYNTDLVNCDGKYCTFDVNDGSMKTLWLDNIKKSNKYEENDRILLTTGSTEEVKKKNLYDIAGNLFEWTKEEGNIEDGDSSSYIFRGGSFIFSKNSWGACGRSTGTDTIIRPQLGFRVTLNIK